MWLAGADFSLCSNPGVRQVWLRVCKRQRDEGQSEDDGELHLQLPERPAGAERVDAAAAPADRGVRRRAESDQKLEGSHPELQEVGLASTADVCVSDGIFFF